MGALTAAEQGGASRVHEADRATGRRQRRAQKAEEGAKQQEGGRGHTWTNGQGGNDFRAVQDLGSHAQARQQFEGGTGAEQPSASISPESKLAHPRVHIGRGSETIVQIRGAAATIWAWPATKPSRCLAPFAKAARLAHLGDRTRRAGRCAQHTRNRSAAGAKFLQSSRKCATAR